MASLRSLVRILLKKKIPKQKPSKNRRDLRGSEAEMHRVRQMELDVLGYVILNSIEIAVSSFTYE